MILANDRWELEASDPNKALASAKRSNREEIEWMFSVQENKHLRLKVLSLQRYCAELQNKIAGLEGVIFGLSVGLVAASIPWILYLILHFMGETP